MKMKFALVPVLMALLFSGVTQAQEATPNQTTATFENWTVRCRPAEDTSEKLCEIVQAVSANGQGSIAMIAVGRLPDEDVTRIAVQLPLGIFLPAGLQVRAGESAINAQVETCFPGFCLARAEFSDEDAEVFSEAETLSLVFKDRTQREVNVRVSLNGFATAYQSVFDGS